MTLKELFNFSKFKLTFTIIITFIILAWTYYSTYSFNKLIMSMCDPEMGICVLSSPFKSTIIYLLPTLIVTYLFSCLIEFIYKKIISNKNPAL